MTKLNDGMLLFHGSYATVEKIDLAMCGTAKDFGKGFYLTSDVKQAKSFINQSIRKAISAGDISPDQRFGFISSFVYHKPMDDIKTYEFTTTDREWLWFIGQNRRERLAAQLRSKIDPDIFNAEIVIGKIANDQTNMTITAYLNGLFGEVESDAAVEDAIKRLMPEKLKDQFCFLTDKAIKCLEFCEARKYVI